MRITGGRARGITLHTPAKAATGLRPATDRLREALFSHLGHLGCFQQDGPLHGLDLFAGTGAYGLEALSRAAHPLSHISFVELSPQHCQLIQQHLAKVCKSAGHNAQHCHVHQANACGPLGLLPLGHFDLIWVDPPYRLYEEAKAQARSTGPATAPIGGQALASAAGGTRPRGLSSLHALWPRLHQWLRPGPTARVIIEHPSHVPAPTLPGLCQLQTLGATRKHKGPPSPQLRPAALAPVCHEPCLTLYGWPQDTDGTQATHP
jgi:16S rRNA (guanine(966)-N(2))-methyltransferase RsmD